MLLENNESMIVVHTFIAVSYLLFWSSECPDVKNYRA